VIGDNRILVVVPARGGSKGIRLKNLRQVLGVPMVARVGHLVARLDWVDRAVVSTDREDIARVAEQAGLMAPFRRPEALSGDGVGDWDVLMHALTEMEKIDGVTYAVVVMLQPTSPLRRAEHVTASVRMLLEGGWDAVWTVSETDSKAHPLKQLTLAPDSGALGYYDAAGRSIVARQQLSPVYHRNGFAYAITRECLTVQKNLMGAHTGGLLIDGPALSIDTEEDIELCEYFMRRHGDPNA
jgi:CMP-N-acetylneuraminic acid synthetase